MTQRVILAIVLILSGALLLLARLTKIVTAEWLYVLAVIFIGAGIVLLLIQRNSPPKLERIADAAPLENAIRAVVKLKHAAGYLKLEAGADAEHLFQGTFDGGVEKKISRADDCILLELRTPRALRTNTYALQPRALMWDIKLAAHVPIEFQYEGGAAQAEFDFSNLNVSSLEINAGASACDVQLPQPRETLRVLIRASAAPIHLRVPPNVPASIRSALGARAPEIDNTRFPARGFGIFQSEKYASAKERIEITVAAGANAVTIR